MKRRFCVLRKKRVVSLPSRSTVLAAWQRVSRKRLRLLIFPAAFARSVLAARHSQKQEVKITCKSRVGLAFRKLWKPGKSSQTNLPGYERARLGRKL